MQALNKPCKRAACEDVWGSQLAKDSRFGVGSLEFVSRQPSHLNPTNPKPRCLLRFRCDGRFGLGRGVHGEGFSRGGFIRAGLSWYLKENVYL